MRFQLRSFLEQLPSQDDIMLGSLLILRQAKRQAPLLVVFMPCDSALTSIEKKNIKL